MVDFRIERMLPTEEAQRLVTEELKEIGLTWKTETFGDDPTTYRCRLFDADGSEVSLGNGKGLGNQSKTSSLFEAYEHFLSSTKKKILGLSQEDIKFLTVEEVSSFDNVAKEKAIELLLELKPKAKIPCQKFTSLDGKKHIYYPFFLTTSSYFTSPIEGDSFDYDIAAKYCSNSGSAIGVGFEEAAIHAIGEVLERDAHSLFLLQSFIKDEPDDIRWVEKAALPDHLQTLIKKVEASFGVDAKIIDMTSDFHIPAFCVTFNKISWYKPATGAGASLSKEYALERAILESSQVAHLHLYAHGSSVEEDKRLTAKIKTFPKYYDCAMHNIDRLISEGRYTKVAYNELPDHLRKGDLHDHIKELDHWVTQNGFRIYTSAHYVSKRNIVCLHAVIPGVEKFFLVHLGVCALPSERGRQKLQSHSIPLYESAQMLSEAGT